MNIQNSIIVAIRALKRNKMRTILTCIGIFIGVACVIIMVGIGNSASIAVRERIHSFGTNAVSITSVKKPFTENDLKDIRRFIPEIQYTTPMNYWEYPIKYKNKNINRQIFGVSNEYFIMNNWQLDSGSFFSKQEMMRYDKVVIIGSSLKTELFGEEDPIGKVILINRVPYRVVGTLIEKGTALSGRDLDNIILGPYSTLAMKLFGTSNFYSIYVSTYDESQVDYVKKSILELFQRKYSLTNDQLQDYKLSTSKELLQMAKQVSGYLTIAFAVVAAISLIVGGIGIMNIMLASVSERTREIGIRMAIGAKNRDILLQFLIEAFIISSFGGIAGIVFGMIAYFLFSFFSHQPFIFSLPSILASFLFAALVGIIFGYLPAKKASDLNPIDALRQE
jgi:putative ABC transport system permease protein